MKKQFNLRPVPAYIITSVFTALVCGSTVLTLFLRRDEADEFTWLAILPAALFLLWTVSAAVVFYKMHRRYSNVFKEILSTFPKEDVDAFMEYTERSPEPEELSRWICGKLMSYESARFNNMAALSGAAMSRDAFWRISDTAMRLDCGEYWERTYGYTDLNKTKDIRLLLSAPTRQEFNNGIKKISEDIGSTFSIFGKLELTPEKPVSVLIQGRSVKDPASGAVVYMGTVCDVDIETKLSEKYKAERTKSKFLQNASPDVLYEVNVEDNRLRALNPKRAKEMLGMGDMMDFDGQRRPYWENIHPDDREGFVDRFFNYDHMTIMPDQKMVYEYRVKNREGDYIWVEHTVQALAFEDGRVTRIIGRISDITMQKRGQQKEQHSIDGLTGAMLRSAVAREFERHIFDGNTRCLILFNINGFHLINNEYGYDSGDQVLRHLVTVLWESQQGRSIVGRLDDDTFVVTMMEVNEKNTPQKVVNKVLARFKEPLEIENRIINVAVSAACSGLFTEHCTFEEAYEQAELAMRACKRDATTYSSAFAEYTDSLREQFSQSDEQ